MILDTIYDLKSPYNQALMMSSINNSKRVFTRIGAFCENFENTLDHLGYMPLVANLSAVGRGFYAISLVACSLAMTIFMIFKALIGVSFNIQKPDFSCVYYSFHGAANIFRTIIESVPFAGNIACASYNLSGYRLMY